MLPSGGWNYGNTGVMGTTLGRTFNPQVLRWPLAGEAEAGGLRAGGAHAKCDDLREDHRCPSPAYALIGMAGHGTWPPGADAWLAAAGQPWRDAAGYTLALVAAWLPAATDARGSNFQTMKRGGDCLNFR